MVLGESSRSSKLNDFEVSTRESQQGGLSYRRRQLKASTLYQLTVYFQLNPHRTMQFQFFFKPASKTLLNKLNILLCHRLFSRYIYKNRNRHNF